MTRHKDLKRIVRDRMTRTGESYTAARAQIISKTSDKPAAMTAEAMAALAGQSNDTIKAKTGRTWPEWVRTLDADGAAALAHRDIAVIVHGKHGVGDWWAQSVTVGYERIKGLRERGQRRDGSYEANKSKTFDVPVTTLFRAWAVARVRTQWLADVKATVRSQTAPKAIRLLWPDGTVVVAGFTPKGPGKSMVALAHTRLPSKTASESSKREWTARLGSLGDLLRR